MSRTTKPKQTNEDRRSQAVKAIIDSARAHFALSGFAGASISVIAQNADVNPSLIYHYFQNKEALWKAVKQSAFTEQAQLDFTSENEHEDLHAFIERVMTTRFEFYRHNQELLKIINWEQLQEGDARLYGSEGDFKWPWNSELKRLIKSGQARPGLDPELAALFMISALRSVFTDVPNLYGAKNVAKKQKEYLKLTIESIYRAFRGSKK